MRCILLLPFLFSCWVTGWGQPFPSYDWHADKTGQPIIALTIANMGWYEVTAADLSQGGHSVGTFNPAHLHLYFRGEEQALEVQTDANGQLERFRFWGYPNDGRIDSLMYRNPITGTIEAGHQPNLRHSLYTDTAVFYLTWDQQPGLRYQIAPTITSSIQVPEASYPCRVYYGNPTVDPGFTYSQGGSSAYDLFYRLNSQFVTGEGYQGPGFSYQDPATISIATPGYALGQGSTRLNAGVFGKSRTNHHISVRLDTFQVADTISLIAQVSQYILSGEVAASLDTITEVEFSAPHLTPPSPETAYHLTWFELIYPRRCDLLGQAHATIANWQSSDSVLFQFEHTAGQDSAWMVAPHSGQLFRGTISANQQAQIAIPSINFEEDLQLITDAGILQPLSLTTIQIPNMCDSSHKADLLVIAPRSLSYSAEAYALYRSTISPQALPSEVFYTDDIYAAFGYGSLTPLAIQDFVNCALAHWQSPPKFVLLWGRGNEYPRSPDQQTGVPIASSPATDWLYVSPRTDTLNGLLPTIPIGRIPCATDDEGLVFLEKVALYETQRSDTWRNKAVFLSGGRFDSEQNVIHRSAIEPIEARWDSLGPGYIRQTLKRAGADSLFNASDSSFVAHYPIDSTCLQLGPLSHPCDSIFRQQLAPWDSVFTHTFADGAGYIMYTGNAIAAFSDLLLPPADSILPEDRYAFVTGFGTYAGQLLQGGTGYWESWLFAERKGAIGYIAPSSVFYLNPLSQYSKLFHANLLDTVADQPIGEVTLATFRSFTEQFPSISFSSIPPQLNLFTDPSLVVFGSDSTQQAIVDSALVWPGDANSDGVADAYDILNIGLTFGYTGSVRDSVDTQWEGKTAQPWAGAFANQLNHKHADCNGDGIVNMPDPQAILDNYGLTHNKTQAVLSDSGLALTIQYPTNGLAGDSLLISVWLGDTLYPKPAYGLAFSLQLNPLYTADSLIFIDFDQAWLGTPGIDALTIRHYDPLSGQLDIGFTRIDQLDQLGAGKLGDITIVITDDIAKRDRGAFTVHVPKGKLIDQLGTDIPLSPVIEGSSSPDMDLPALAVQIYPQPADGILHLLSAHSWSQARLLDLTSRTVWAGSLKAQSQTTIQVDYLQAGVYILDLQHGNQRHTQKVLIQ